MTLPPSQPKIYHITHVDNLPRIIATGGLLSDVAIRAQGGPAIAIGMSDIKRRRMEELAVHCHRSTRVGDYVPFYFCPRSVMLYLIYKANHPELTYRSGQGPIMHLEVDLHQVVRWAETQGRRWAFSLANAGARYVEFRNRITELDQLNWQAIAAIQWQPPDIKEPKQAEFLVHESFPWELVTRIGVYSRPIAQQVVATLRGAAHRPAVEIRPEWYY